MKSGTSRWLVIGAFVLVGLVAWSNSFESGFVFDNGDLLLKQTRIQRLTAENLSDIFQHSYWWPAGDSGLYRPITTLSFLFNYAILGDADHPEGYHWINLILHAINVFLVFVLTRKLLRELAPAVIAAGVWSVHPVLTESVTNIVGRADLWAGMSVIGGLLAYLKSAETTGQERRKLLTVLAGITVLGCFAKESAVSLFAVIVVYELTWWQAARMRHLLTACAAMAPALALMWWARSEVLGHGAGGTFPFVDNPIVAAGFWNGRLTAVKVMAQYMRLLVWPAHLSADYSWAQIRLTTGSAGDWAAWAAVALTTAGTALLYRRNKPAFFAAGFAFVTFLPTSNLLIPVGTIMAERFLYLPAIGLAICLALALGAAARRLGGGDRAAIAAGLLIAAGFGARTLARNADWRDDYTLWSAQALNATQSFKTHVGLAKAMVEPDHYDIEGALSEMDKALAILDRVPDRLNESAVYYRFGATYLGIGRTSLRRDAYGNTFRPESIERYKQARAMLEKSVTIMRAQGFRGPGTEPERITSTFLLLSETDQVLGSTAESLDMAREAQRWAPLSAEVYARLHDSLVAAGNDETGARQQVCTTAAAAVGSNPKGSADLTNAMGLHYGCW